MQKAISNLTKNRTSFVIAHRLSTIKNADLILVLKDGAIIEKGTHKELMEQNGFYQTMYNTQYALWGDFLVIKKNQYLQSNHTKGI